MLAAERSAKYGTEAVVFQAAGVESYHTGDSEAQVIFDGYSLPADRIAAITRSSEDRDMFTVLGKKTGREYHKFDTIYQAAEWIRDFGSHSNYRWDVFEG